MMQYDSQHSGSSPAELSDRQLDEVRGGVMSTDPGDATTIDTGGGGGGGTAVGSTITYIGNKVGTAVGTTATTIWTSITSVFSGW